MLGADLDVALPALGSEVGFSQDVRPGVQPTAGCRAAGRSSSPAVPASGWRAGSIKRVPRVDDAGPAGVRRRRRARWSTIVTDLPASERFFTGGDTTVRGFALDRLGTEATLERRRLSDRRQRHGRAQPRAAHAARSRASGWSASSTPATCSCGPATWTSATCAPRPGSASAIARRSGPLRFDVGFKLDRRDFTAARERRAVYHLSLGQAF